MKSIIKQPLFHFLLIAGLIFLLNSFIGNTKTEGDKKIYIDDGVESVLIERFKSQWKREPNAEELTNLIDDYIKKEVLYREALALHLDENDEIIKRRMQQKMYALLSDVSEIKNEITDSEIENFYNDNIEKYTRPAQYSFYQIGFENSNEASTAYDKIKNLTPQEANLKGDIELFPYYVVDVDEKQLISMFGGDLPKTITELEKNKWTKNIQSGFGYHLIYLNSIKPPEKIELKNIKDIVIDDLQFTNAQKNEDEIYRELLNNYKILETN